ncbi:hypothetical protein BDQ17DRAFT_1424194 [Cyathus striatus]|nr:hypothetical protein BDQ17DRAFT_1424194 [Cyathus striatus]
MELEDADCPDLVSIIAVHCSGIFIHLEVNSPEAAHWFKQQCILHTFGSCFDSTSNPVPSTFKLLTEFVPTTYQPGPATLYTDLEQINDLPVGLIVEIKPACHPSLWKTGKYSAHFVVSLHDQVWGRMSALHPMGTSDIDILINPVIAVPF